MKSSESAKQSLMQFLKWIESGICYGEEWTGWSIYILCQELEFIISNYVIL